MFPQAHFHKCSNAQRVHAVAALSLPQENTAAETPEWRTLPGEIRRRILSHVPHHTESFRSIIAELKTLPRTVHDHQYGKVIPNPVWTCAKCGRAQELGVVDVTELMCRHKLCSNCFKAMPSENKKCPTCNKKLYRDGLNPIAAHTLAHSFAYNLHKPQVLGLAENNWDVKKMISDIYHGLPGCWPEQTLNPMELLIANSNDFSDEYVYKQLLYNEHLRRPDEFEYRTHLSRNERRDVLIRFEKMDADEVHVLRQQRSKRKYPCL